MHYNYLKYRSVQLYHVPKDIDSVKVSMATDYFREFYEENLGGGLKIQRRRTKSKL